VIELYLRSVISWGGGLDWEKKGEEHCNVPNETYFTIEQKGLNREIGKA